MFRDRFWLTLVLTVPVVYYSEHLRHWFGYAWRDLYALRDAGEILELSRGLFQVADMAGTSDPDFVAVCARAPQGTICLDSALAYWDLSDDIPDRVHLAVPAGTHRPAIDYPPTQVHVFQASTFDLGRLARHGEQGERFGSATGSAPWWTRSGCATAWGRMWPTPRVLQA